MTYVPPFVPAVRPDVAALTQPQTAEPENPVSFADLLARQTTAGEPAAPSAPVEVTGNPGAAVKKIQPRLFEFSELGMFGRHGAEAFSTTSIQSPKIDPKIDVIPPRRGEPPAPMKQPIKVAVQAGAVPPQPNAKLPPSPMPPSVMKERFAIPRAPAPQPSAKQSPPLVQQTRDPREPVVAKARDVLHRMAPLPIVTPGREVLQSQQTKPRDIRDKEPSPPTFRERAAVEQAPRSQTVSTVKPGATPLKQEPVEQEPVKQETVRQEPVKLEVARQEPAKQASIKPQPVKQARAAIESEMAAAQPARPLAQAPPQPPAKTAAQDWQSPRETAPQTIQPPASEQSDPSPGLSEESTAPAKEIAKPFKPALPIAPRLSNPTNLVVSSKGDALVVVARGQIESTDEFIRLKRMVEETAAEFGVDITEFQLNGSQAEPSFQTAIGGKRGNRTR